MQGLRSIHPEGRSPSLPRLSTLIGDLGSPAFNGGLFDFFNEISAVEHCGVYVLKARKLKKCAGISQDGSGKSKHFVDLYIDNGYWLADPTMDVIGREAVDHDSFLVEVDTTSVGGSRFREELFISQKMLHRLMVCLRMDEGIAVLDLVRSSQHGPFGREKLDIYSSTSDILLPLILRHFDVLNDRQTIGSDILRDLPSIEERLAAKETHLPQRERQVAAHILYGQSTLGISIDLGIAEETVATYRKRLYTRLQISSQQELCRWFLRAA